MYAINFIQGLRNRLQSRCEKMPVWPMRLLESQALNCLEEFSLGNCCLDVVLKCCMAFAWAHPKDMQSARNF